MYGRSLELKIAIDIGDAEIKIERDCVPLAVRLPEVCNQDAIMESDIRCGVREVRLGDGKCTIRVPDVVVQIERRTSPLLVVVETVSAQNAATQRDIPGRGFKRHGTIAESCRLSFCEIR